MAKEKPSIIAGLHIQMQMSSACQNAAVRAEQFVLPEHVDISCPQKSSFVFVHRLSGDSRATRRRKCPARVGVWLYHTKLRIPQISARSLLLTTLSQCSIMFNKTYCFVSRAEITSLPQLLFRFYFYMRVLILTLLKFFSEYTVISIMFI